jgi:hypothetical protein
MQKEIPMNKPLIYVAEASLDQLTTDGPITFAHAAHGAFALKPTEHHKVAYVPLELVLFVGNKLATTMNQHQEVIIQTYTELLDEILEYKAMMIEAFEELRKELHE